MAESHLFGPVGTVARLVVSRDALTRIHLFPLTALVCVHAHCIYTSAAAAAAAAHASCVFCRLAKEENIYEKTYPKFVVIFIAGDRLSSPVHSPERHE